MNRGEPLLAYTVEINPTEKCIEEGDVDAIGREYRKLKKAIEDALKQLPNSSGYFYITAERTANYK